MTFREILFDRLRLKGGTRIKKSTTQIVRAICQKIDRENIDLCLTFHGIDRWTPEERDRLIKTFWKPLEKEYRSKSRRSKLLLCWVESKSLDRSNPIYCPFDDIDRANWQSDRIYEMPITQCFDRDDLKDWFRRPEVCALSASIDSAAMDREIEQIVEQVWQISKGNPYQTLLAIYELFGLKWEEHQDRWIKL
ncbi:hypothetical protein POG22_12420 [Geitlerinema sp. CS-897]|nr:hypothetical protein [Geitlerinema sp. CS-897]